MDKQVQREQFSSRVGFILMAAGCAIGLGNVWRFSYIAGEYGGGFFLLLYLLFLVILGFPVLLMELAIGRAGRSTFPGAFRNLQPPQGKFKWHKFVFLLFSGNLILLMFYSVIAGWLLFYATGYIRGEFTGVTPEQSGKFFNNMLADPAAQTISMLVGVLITVVVCMGGVRKTIEKVIKYMMIGLLVLLLALVFYALSMPNAVKGLSFFLKPDWGKFVGDGVLNTAHAAMAQAFFTLSLGVGSMAICGSYTSRERSLASEGVWIITLDTLVAVFSGLVIFPACASSNIAPDAGPPLIFITLPNVFANMQYGNFWGFLFFIFLAFAALSTLIAVFENLVSFGMDELKWSRKRSGIFFAVLLAILSMPCILGFNLLKKFQPFGPGSNVLDLEDFIVSDNLLPLGALYIIIFCTSRYGWGREKFMQEINTGSGIKIPEIFHFYLKWILPVLVLTIWFIGIAKRFNIF